jgi:hypothetical protein
MIETFLNCRSMRNNIVLVGYPVVTPVGREMREDVISESLVASPRRPKGVEIEAVCGIQLLLDIKGCKSSYGSTKRVSGDLNGGCGVLSE